MKGRIYDNDTGDIAIGSTNPLVTLDVAGKILARTNAADAVRTRFITGKDPVNHTANGDLFLNCSNGFPVYVGSGDTLTDFIVQYGDMNVNSGDLFVDETAASVGVGNTSPDYKLDVSGTINANAQVALRASGNSAVEYSSSLFSWGKGGTKNYFEDPVGIGDAIPLATLDVALNSGYDVARFGYSGSSYEEIHIGMANSDWSYLGRNYSRLGAYPYTVGVRDVTGEGQCWWLMHDDYSQFGFTDASDNGAYLKLNSAGVGVNRTPESALDIQGNVIVRSGSPTAIKTCFVSGMKSSSDTSNGDLYLNYENGDEVRVGSGSRETDLVVMKGNMGIGVTYPDYRLDLNGHMRIHTPYSIYDENARNHICLDNGSEGMNIACDGRLLINADYNSSGSGDIYLTTKGQLGLYVKNNGHVGIKTSDPKHALDVAGGAAVRGTLHVSTGDYRIQTEMDPYYPHFPPMLAFHSPQVGAEGYTTPKTVVVPPIGGFMVANAFNGRYNIHVLENGNLVVKGVVKEGSDSRIKLNRRPLNYGLDQVLALKPQRYDVADWAVDEGTRRIEIVGISETNCIGLIAQEVHEAIPEAVSVPEDDTSQIWSITYSRVVAVLVKGMQEQQEEIELLQQQMMALRQEVEALQDSR